MALELKNTTSVPAAPRAATRITKLKRTTGRFSAKDRMFFTERLALLLDTGNPLYTSLDILAQQADKPIMAKMVNELREDIAGGLAFSQALAKHPAMFSSAYVNLIGASEQGGFMADVLKQLMEMEEKSAQLRATIVSAFTYPGFLTVFSFAVIMFILTVVFPKFEVLFTAIADQLPASTLVLMAASDLLRQHWLVLVTGLGAIVFGLTRWLASKRGMAALDRFKLSVPIVRNICIELYIAQSMRVIGLSLGHGVSVPDTLRACRDVVKNSVYRRLMEKVELEVNEGRGIAAGFEDSDIVPPLAQQMIATGDRSGNVSMVATRIADFYERELTKRLTLFSKLIEPVMLLVMGVVVGLIVASLILPIFKLSKAVH